MSYSIKLIIIVSILSILYAYLDKIYNKRIYDLERQDKNEIDGNYTREEFVDMMHILTELNLADLNGHNATLYQFDQLSTTPKSIIEIGFGLGHLSIMLANKYPNANVLGIDSHQHSVNAAMEYLGSLDNRPSNVRFELRPVVELNEPRKSVDVITTTFVNHHIFPDAAFVDFLERVAKQGRQAFIFNDLTRSLSCIAATDAQLLAVRYIGMDMLSKILDFIPVNYLINLREIAKIFKERIGLDLVIDGGMLSIRRSFSMQEYEKLFEQAGYPANSLTCYTANKWYSPLAATCRAVCVADLTWSN